MTDEALQNANAATKIDGVEKALLKNDLSQLSPDERKDYYARVCESTGLNPLTQPLEYIYLNGDLTLYANKTAANQLRMEYDISITKIEEEQKWGLHIVQAYASTPNGRTDVDEGAVSVEGLSGESLANARMKAITKAKRRVTLSICGLGFLDRTEVADIHDGAKEATVVDHETGKIKGEDEPEQIEPTTVEWEMPDGDRSFKVSPKAADRLDEIRDGLSDLEGADLAAAVTKFRGNDWPDPEASVLGALLDYHEQRLTDTDEGQTNDAQKGAQAPSAAQDPSPQQEQQARYDGPQDALNSCFDEAWAEGKESWEAISDSQLNRLFAIADDQDWDEAALNRLIKDELGWDSKADVPYGDPYDEICEALEDKRLRYHMSRDPDTEDMFEDDTSTNESGANDEAFEEGDDDPDLPF